MGKITLESLEFYAYHGVTEEERKVGNKYLVDMTVHTLFDEAAKHDDLSGTVDYEKLYGIIRNEMAIPAKLLENIAHRICSKTLADFQEIDEVCVNISKMNPPIGGICKKVTISLCEKRQ